MKIIFICRRTDPAKCGTFATSPSLKATVSKGGGAKKSTKYELRSTVLPMAMLLFFNSQSFAQSGSSCSNAIPVIPAAVCSLASYTTTDSVRWFSFVAASPYMQITEVSPTFGISGPHIHRMVLYSGTCSGLQVLEEEVFAEINGANEIIIDASGLTVGATYYVKASRLTSGGICVPTPAVATPCGGVTGITFSLCVRSLNVIIPKDFGLEPAAISHAYHTNKGQIIDVNGNPRHDIKDYTNNSSPAVYHTDTSTSFVFASIDTIASTPDTLHRVDMTLVGANAAARPFKTEKVSGYLNYFLGHVPTGAANIKGYSRTVNTEVYPDIDMQYYSNDAGVKFYFIVKPGGNADNIVLKFTGANSVSLTPSKGLQITTSLGTITFDPGHAYQVNPAGNIVPMPWQAEFIQLSPTEVKFDIRNYPANFPLFIQVDRGHVLPTPPSSSDWSTYLGGSGNDVGMDITTDATGNVYFCGTSGSINFPNIIGGVFTTNTGNDDAFVEKYNPLGVPIFGTYFGGSANEHCFALARNSTGDIYIVGHTFSNNLPLMPPGNTVLQGMDDAFIARFNNTGSAFLFSRYYGGNNPFFTEQARSVAVDGLDNVYMVGETPSAPSANFPLVTKSGAYNQSASGASSSYPDAFIAEFNSSNAHIWGTYFGGNAQECFTKVLISSNNSILLSGSTGSSIPASSNVANTPCGVPTTTTYFPDCDPGGGAYFQTLINAGSGSEDAMIVEFDQNGALIWSTYFGGQGQESSFNLSWRSRGSIVIDPNNPNILYLVGTTSKFDYPLFLFTSMEYGQTQTWIGSTNRAFIAKFNSKVLLWSTIFGSGSITDGDGVTMDNSGNVFISGNTANNSYTNSAFTCQPAQNEFTEFPYCNPGNIFFQNAYGGGTTTGETFISSFNSLNKMVWSTYYGGSSNEDFRAIKFDPVFRRIYITGRTQSTSGLPLLDPMTGNYQQNSNGGVNFDAYIGRFDIPLVFSVNDLSNQQSQVGVFPNPALDNIFINVNSNEKGNLKIQIYNTMGAIVMEQNEKIISSEDLFKINVSKVALGIYFIKATVNNKTFNAKFIRQ